MSKGETVPEKVERFERSAKMLRGDAAALVSDAVEQHALRIGRRWEVRRRRH